MQEVEKNEDIVIHRIDVANFRTFYKTVNAMREQGRYLCKKVEDEKGQWVEYHFKKYENTPIQQENTMPGVQSNGGATA